MEGNNDPAAIDALNLILSTLNRLEPDARQRVLSSVITFFGAEASPRASQAPSSPKPGGLSNLGFSTSNAPTPKAFLVEKQPRTDVERVACLAYYLTHYRDTPYFKTLDLGKLNTEAAQPKFSNAAYSSNNALKMGYLAAANKGMRQLSAAGEQFVAALPDRDAAKLAMTNARPRRSRRKSSGASDSESEDSDPQ